MNILGVWMWPYSVEKRGAEQVVAWCARAKVTDIFFLVKGMAGKAACRSSYAPTVCERDLLQELLQAAHANGIRVHAWFTSASDAHYKELHPESGRCHFVRGRDKGLISLADEPYMAYLENIIREICRNYEIDGLHLDYIRYNHVAYGWAPEDLERYAAEGADTDALCRMIGEACETGDVTPLLDAYRKGDKNIRALARARRKDVVRFARRMLRAAKSEKNDLILTAALLPEGAFEDIAFADLHYGQNYEDAVGLYDYVLPMAYSKAYKQNGQWVKEIAERSVKLGHRTVVGLHAYEGGTGPSLQEDLDAVADAPVEGICLFREGATVLAFAGKEQVTVFNPLPEAITKVIARMDGGSVQWECRIETNAKAEFSIAEAPRVLQVFAGEEERCVYLTKEA